MPLPGVSDDRFQIGKLRRPVQMLSSLLRRGVQDGGITRRAADRGSRAPFGPSLSPPRSMTSFTECGCPVPRLYASDADPFPRASRALHVRSRQDRRRGCSRAGRCRRASDSRRRRSAERDPVHCRLDRARDEVDLRRMVFAELAVGIGASRIEVAERRPPDPVGALEMRKRPLHGQLRLAVGVDRLSAGAFRRSAFRPARRRWRRSTKTRSAQPTRRPWLRARPSARRRCCGSTRPDRAPTRRHRGTPQSA